MRIHKLELRSELYRFFPRSIGGIYLGDSQYWTPKQKNVEKFLELSWVDKRTYLTNTWDCNNFSLTLLCESRMYTSWLVEFEIVKKEDALPWSLVEVWVSKYKGREGSHAINAVLTQDKGLLLIEPQTDEIWRPEEGSDIFCFIRG